MSVTSTSAYLYQLTTWLPERVAPGTAFATVWHESNYWSQQGNLDAQTAFLLETVFSPSRVPEFANLGVGVATAIARAKAIAQANKEDLCESVRATHFGAMPSRRNALFACDTLADLRRYLEIHSFPIANRHVVQLEVLNATDLTEPERAAIGPLPPDLRGATSRIHRADSRWLNCNGLSANASATR